MLRNTFVYVALLAIGACLSTSPARAELSLSQVIENVRESEKLVTNGSGTTVVQVKRNPSTAVDGAGVPTEDRTIYKWAFVGNEWRQELKTAYPPYTTEGKTVVESVCDGKLHRYWPDAKEMTVFGGASRGKIEMSPLWAQYLDLAAGLDEHFQFLSAEMVSANPAIAGNETVGGVDTVMLKGKSLAGQDVTWWLAPTYGCRPVKRETRWQIAGGNGKEAVVTDIYGGYAEVATGAWLPSTASCTKTVGGDSPANVVLKVTVTTSFESINGQSDPSKLRISPSPGTEITYVDDVESKG